MATSSTKSVLSLFPLFLVLIIDAMGFGIIFPLIGPLFLIPGEGLLDANASAHIRELCYGLSISYFFLFMLVGSPFIGDLSDKIGRKKVVLLCIFGTAAAYLLCVISFYISSVMLFLMGRSLAGFLAGSQSIAQAAIIDISTPKTKTKNLAFMTLASCVGFTIGPLVGGIFSSSEYVSWVNDTTPFTIAAVLSLINGVGLIFLFQETHVVKIREKVKIMKVFVMLKEAWTDNNVRNVALLFLGMQLGWGLFYQYISFYLVQSLNYNGFQIGLFNASIGILFCLTLVWLIHRFLKILTLKALTLLTLLMQGLTTILFMTFTSELSVWLLLVPVTLSVGLSYTCLLSLFSEAVSSQRQGWVMGVSEAVMAIAWIVGSIFTANIGLFPAGSLFLVAGILPLIACFFIRVNKNRLVTNDDY